MNPFKFVWQRPMTTLLLVTALPSGAVYGMYKKRVEVPALHTTQVYASLDSASVHAEGWKVRLESYFHKGEEEEVHHEQHSITLTSPLSKDVTITQQYVCQIRSQNHIDVFSLEGGYLDEIAVREGQAVKKGDLMFKINQTLYKARLAAELAEVNLAALELKNTQKLVQNNVVSAREQMLLEAKLQHAQAKADVAAAELKFTEILAPFDGIVDRLEKQLGSLIKEEDVLTRLYDNTVMWVYFNVPEQRYLQFMAEGPNPQISDIELILASHNKFPQLGKIDTAKRIGAIEGKFNNETGNIAFRADFANPLRVLRHGQTGTVLINHLVKNAIVIPMRATFENLAKRYVFVVDKEGTVRQREIEIADVLEDVFVISKGVDVNDRIVLEGTRQVRDGDKLVEFEFVKPEEALKDQKNKAE